MAARSPSRVYSPPPVLYWMTYEIRRPTAVGGHSFSLLADSSVNPLFFLTMLDQHFFSNVDDFGFIELHVDFPDYP